MLWLVIKYNILFSFFTVLETFSVNPKPEWLVNLDISRWEREAYNVFYDEMFEMWYILRHLWLWILVCKQQCYFDRNKLPCLPSWASECFFMVKLDASHNVITDLPPRWVGVVPLKVWLFYGSTQEYLLLKFDLKVFVLSTTIIKGFLLDSRVFFTFYFDK